MFGQISLLLAIVAVSNAYYLGGPLVGPSAPGVVLGGPDGSAIISPPKPGGVVSASYSPGVVGAPYPYLGGYLGGYGYGPVAPSAVLKGPSGVVSTGLGGTVVAGPSKVLLGGYL